MRRVTTVIFFALLAWLMYNGPGYGSVSANINKKKPKSSNLQDVPEVIQNFHIVSRGELNKRIWKTMDAFYLYMAMSNYFDRADIALPGFQKLFRKYSDMELDNARLLMDYVNKRGSALKLHQLKSPTIENWSNGLTALNRALKTQVMLNEEFHHTVEVVAVSKNDPHFKHFLEDNFIDSKFKVIKEIKDYIAVLKRLQEDQNPGLGLYMFDKSLQMNLT